MRLIEDPRGLDAVASELSGQSVLYLDTEFESSRAGTELCLLQISAGGKPILIDTIRLRSLAPLGQALQGPDVEWVLHAGQQDIELLCERVGVPRPPKIFDTQLAWALTSPEYSVSLAYLSFRMLGLRSSKAYQADDWKRRPLPAAQLRYAASDIEHLPELRAKLRAELDENDRVGFLYEACREQFAADSEPPQRMSLDSFRNAWQLDAKNQAALRFLIEWFNQLPARERKYAPDTKGLLAIASRLPATSAELGRIKGVPRAWVQHNGERVVAGLARAVAEADAADFVPIDPPPYATFQEIRFDAWLATLRAEVCAELCVAPELAMPSRLQKRVRAALLAGDAFDVALDALGGWRKQLLGAALERFAAAHPAPL